MEIKKCVLLFALTSLTALPILTHADIVMTNHTDSYGTGTIAFSPCSSEAGDRGIMKPHDTLTIPQFAIGLYCGLLPCSAHLFATKDCSGKEIATLSIEPSRGVTGINNLDKEHYILSGGGGNVTVDPGQASGFKNWLRLLF